MQKILENDTKAKEHLDALPKVYALFLWAKWGILELPWAGMTVDGTPLVYTYYDCNGTCDEYRLVEIRQVSSGGFGGWYKDREEAEEAQKKLNGEIANENV